MHGWRALAGVFVLFLAACAGNAPLQPFLSPTQAAPLAPSSQSRELASPTPAPTEETHPTAIPACSDSLTFIEDLTIPDGMSVAPGSELDKRWRVKNSGTCNWHEDYRVKFLSGTELGAPSEQALYPARGGTELVIRILYKAPVEEGVYQSAWQALSPEGVPFGDPFYIQITVVESASAPE